MSSTTIITSVIYILIALVVIIILLYYFWYIKEGERDNKEIPHELLSDPEKTIVDLLEDISNKYGHHIAFKTKKHNNVGWNAITYYDYNKQAKCFAEKILYHIDPHPRVAILSSNRPEWHTIHMGTLISGGISVGISPSMSNKNCQMMIDHASIDLLVVEDINQLSKLFDMKIPTVKTILIIEPDDKKESYEDIKEDIKSNIMIKNPNLQILQYDQFMNSNIGNLSVDATIEIGKTSPDDTAVIVYTTDGEKESTPKGIMITHKNIMSAIRSSIYAIRSQSNINMCIQEKYISNLPLNSSLAQTIDIYIPMATVGVVHFTKNHFTKNKEELFDDLIDIRPTVFVGLPDFWENVSEKMKIKKEDRQNLLNRIFIDKMVIKEFGFNKCKYCISLNMPKNTKSSTNTSKRSETKQFFKDIGLEICDVVGMDQTAGFISMAVPNCSDNFGRPVLNVKIDSTTDEILVKGIAVFNEYYKNKDATEKAFDQKGWFKTGMTGCVDRNDSLIVNL